MEHFIIRLLNFGAPSSLRTNPMGLLRYRTAAGATLLMMGIMATSSLSALVMQRQVILQICLGGLFLAVVAYVLHVRGMQNIAGFIALTTALLCISAVVVVVRMQANTTMYFCLLPIGVYLYYGLENYRAIIGFTLLSIIPYLVWIFVMPLQLSEYYPTIFIARFWNIFNFLSTMLSIGAVLYLFAREELNSKNTMAYQLALIEENRMRLAENEANLHAIVLSLDDIVFQIDYHLIIRNVWSSKRLSLYEDALATKGKHVEDVFPSDILPNLQASLRQAFDQQVSAQISYFFLPTNEWYMFRISPVTFMSQSGEEQNANMLSLRQRTASIVVSNITEDKIRDAKTELNRQLVELNEQLEARVAERTKELDDSKMELQIQVVERWMAEQKLAEALGREHTFNEMKTNLIQMLSHQFRTPLTYIQNGFDFIDLAMKKAKPLSPEKMERVMQSVSAGMEQIVDMIDGVTSLMTVQTELLSEKPSDFDLTKTMNTVLSTVSYISFAQERVKVHIDGMPVAQSIAGAVLIVIRELVKNALLYSPKESQVCVEITEDIIDFEGLESAGIRVVVSDHGKGIPQEEEEKIFDYFYRAGEQSAVGSDRALGIGLGLATFCTRLTQGSLRYVAPSAATNNRTQFVFEFPQFMTT